ncbi:MAG: hypothetical protein QNJ72_15875 [Pleurocapsa sp. MO_226.B13]|nr:hypothetical protein [Pleurocapsa sp. MO_226.B13]
MVSYGQILTYCYLTLIFACSWLLLLNEVWLIAIAPSLSLLFSAAIATFYRA